MSEANRVSRLLSTKQAADIIGCGESTLEKMRVFGGGPKYVKLSKSRRGRVVYDPVDIEAWVADRKRSNTSEPLQGARA